MLRSSERDLLANLKASARGSEFCWNSLQGQRYHFCTFNSTLLTLVLVGVIFALSLYLTSTTCSAPVLPHTPALLNPESRCVLTLLLSHDSAKASWHTQFKQGMLLQCLALVASNTSISGACRTEAIRQFCQDTTPQGTAQTD